MSRFVLDLKVVFRQLGKSAGFAATAVLMLAFGIGATTAIFSIVEGVLLRPLPFPDPGQLVTVGDKIQGVDFGIPVVTVPDIRAYTRDTHSFDGIGGYTFASFELSGVGEPAQVDASRLTAGVFTALKVQPLLGRVFTAEEDEKHQQVALLSYATWKNRFQGNPRIVGTRILLDRNPYVVIGVMPQSFEFPLVPGHLNRAELWVPVSFTAQELSTNAAASWNFQMVARLKPGVTAAQAQSDAERVAQEIMRNYPANMASLRITAVVRSLHEVAVEQARPLVRTLFLAVAVVLLIACANLAGLLLVRAIRRQRELSVRLALGAPASALVWQALLESLVLSLSGGLLGIVLASIALSLGRSLLPESLPLVSTIGLNWTVASFALLLAVGTGLLCGLAPAFASIRTRMNDTLKEGGRSGSSGGGHSRLRSTLVVAEIAIALMLLATSGLLLRSFEKMRSVDLGFQPEQTTTASYSLPQKQYATQAQIDAFNRQLLDRLRQLPGAESAALTSFLPAAGNGPNETFVVQGYVPPKDAKMNLAVPYSVMGDYFRTMGIPLVRGRFFTEADKSGAQLVVIVNHKLAQHYWPNQDPIGQHMRIGTTEMQTPWMTVVGEVADVKQGSPDDPAKEQFYTTVAQSEDIVGSLASPGDLNGNGGFIVLRSILPPEQMENALRSTVRSIDPQLPLTQVQTLVQAVSDSEAPRRFNTVLISGFALAAVLLAVLGIYGVIAFSVASRTRELAIRMALGSQRFAVVRLILGSGARLAAIGCALGLAGAAAASRLLRSLLFGVSPFDPLVMVLAAAAIFVLALVASALPARNAASVDPLQALRGE